MRDIIDLVKPALTVVRSSRVERCTSMLTLEGTSKIDSMSFDELQAEIDETERTLTSLKAFRDGAARGSSKRADFASSIRRLSSWRDRLQRKFDTAVDARNSSRKKRKG